LGSKITLTQIYRRYEKPWLKKREKGAHWDRPIVYGCMFIGLCMGIKILPVAWFLIVSVIGAYLCYAAIEKVPKHDYCLIMDDQFSTLDTNVWSHEIQVDGFGTGSFDWTTDDPANSYTDSAGLHIVPTLTLQSTNISYSELTNGYTVNLTSDGTCTAADQRVPSTDYADLTSCVAHSNLTHGTIINPVRSARLTTAGKKTIKYGRVIVEAKMPRGDWLWPAIWMMPEDSVYGPWPRSGEIDIAEGRGNDPTIYPLGSNIINSAIHWGTASVDDRYLMTSNIAKSKREKAYDGFHTYGLEWSEKYLFTWLDDRLRQVYFMDFTRSTNMWTYGNFAGTTVNGTEPDDPWSQTGQPNTPFDQDFYLILNVAVGSTNGYFPDAVGSKPWGDSSHTAMGDFWKANDTWLPTWGAGDERGMTVRSVQMWQQGAC